jgi:hypothetical protein
MADLKIKMEKDEDGMWESIEICFKGCPLQRIGNHKLDAEELMIALEENGLAEIEIVELPVEDN